MNELNEMHKVNKKYSAEAIESREKYVRVKYSSGEASTKHSLEEAMQCQIQLLRTKNQDQHKSMFSNSTDQREDNTI